VLLRLFLVLVFPEFPTPAATATGQGVPRVAEPLAHEQSVGRTAQEENPAQPGGAKNAPSRTIGIEGSFSLELPRADYRPRPLDDRTELILRIDAITPANGQYRYYFYYMGMEPGVYKLADYLVRPDGSRPEELENIPLSVRSLLPEDHNGHLNAFVPDRFPFIGGYRVFLAVIGLAWAGGIAAFVVSYRKKKVVIGPAVEASTPSLAELMRPLVEAAATGKLDTDGQAHLERLLMGYWRERLNFSAELRMADAVARLKEHAQAGELLRALERWLHRPGGVSAAEINALLEPYRAAAAPGPIAGEPGRNGV
jgi:hypothetical protein